MSPSTSIDSSTKVEVPHIPGLPYIPHRYSVIIRAGEALDTHLDQLKEYAKTATVESHDSENVELKLGSVIDLMSCYFATLPPGILQWLQERPEVQSIEQQTYHQLC
ncbi:hypothetical protein B0H13DRAFT_1853968 [Mycena leptocephala]|nr:hypothetical protein B0H13DRAFT_1853968 [Mycena leptocephala]